MDDRPLEHLTLTEIEREPSGFCPQADGDKEYRPAKCLPGCTICRDLLITQGGTP